MSHRARLLERRALSDASRRAYASDWSAWAAWCAARELEPLPLEWGRVNEWLSDADEAGLRLNTLRRRVASLSVVAQLGGPEHLEHGERGAAAMHPDDARPPESTLNVLHNVARLHAERGDRVEARAEPMLARQLREVVGALGRTPADLRDRVLLLVGWFGCLRPSELAHARWSALSWKPGSAVLRLGATKTDQGGARDEWVELPMGLTPDTDPLRALREWRELLELRGVADDGPILRAVDRGGRVGAPLSRQAVADRIRACARRAGLGHVGYSGHSLRRGAVTEAVGAGVPAALVRAQSRHRSVEVFERYVDKAALPNRVPTAGLA